MQQAPAIQIVDKPPPAARSPLFKFLFALLVLAIPVIALHMPINPQRDDWPAYYAAAKLVLSHHAADAYKIEAVHTEAQQFYSIPTVDGKYQFVGEPPFLLAMYAPLGLLTAPIANVLNTMLEVIATAAALTFLSLAIPLTNRATLVLFAVTAVSGPFWEATRSGKPAPFFLLAFCFGLWLLRRGLSGAPAAFAWCLMKPHHIAPFLLFSLAARKFRFIATTAAIGIAMLLLSLPLFGLSGWSNYFHIVDQIANQKVNVGVAFQPTFRGQFFRLTGDLQLSNAVALITSAVGLVACGWLGTRFAKSRDWWLAAAATTPLIATTFSFHCHPYDLLMLIPSLAILIDGCIRKKRMFMLASLVAVCAAYSLPFYLPLYYWCLFAEPSIRPNLLFIVLAVASACAVVYVCDRRLRVSETN